jgi:hypothetical protein
MLKGEFDPGKTKACMIFAFVLASIAVKIIYAPYWQGTG